MCLNLPNGELTSSEQPMTMIIDHKGEDDGEVGMHWRIYLHLGLLSLLCSMSPTRSLARLPLSCRWCHQVEFNFKMEFNGASFDMTEKWEKELFPETIDAVSISYTNSRSFFKMKMRRIE